MKKEMVKFGMFLLLVMALGCSNDDSGNTPVDVVKTKVSVTRIKVTTIPTKNGFLDWDSASNPDLFIKCYDESNILGPTSNTVWNVIPSVNNAFECVFSTPLTTTDLNYSQLKIEVWDDDSDNGTANDKIGEVLFPFIDYTTGADKYPPYVIKSSSNGTVVTIYLTWE